MRKFVSGLLAGVSAVVLSSAVEVQAQPAAPQSDAEANEGGAAAGDIVVTARRRSETLQEVPQTVNVITEQAIQDYGVLNFEDLANLVPGINLSGAGSQGFNQSIQVRGVPFQITDQAASPTTATYLNEAPVDSALIFQNTYDLGQVEVLKGPQGTSRGISSPSGAFTSTTRPADPAGGYDGYVQTTVDDHNTVNLQGALNIPIIEDLFAIRLAGVDDTNEGSGVRSATTSENPDIQTESYRVSATLTPSDNFRARIMYQHVDTENKNFGGTLFGAGECAPPYNNNATPTPVGTLCSPSNANPLQPPITAGQLLADNNNTNMFTQNQGVIIANLEYSVANNLISYIWSQSKWALDNYSDSDTNNLVNVRIPTRQTMEDAQPSTVQTHEIRIASEEPILSGLLDYTFGAFWTELDLVSVSPQGAATRYPGSFGRADQAPNRDVFQLEYTRHGNVPYNHRQDSEGSVYGEINLHLTDDLEVSIGGRQLETFLSSTRYSQAGGLLTPGSGYLLNLGPQANCSGSVSPVGLGGGMAQMPNPLTDAQARALFGLGAAATTVPNVALQPSAIYPGTCDAVIPAGATTGTGAAQTFVPGAFTFVSYAERTIRPEVFNVSVSYDLTDDIMVYANTGTAFRQGSVSVTQAPVCFDAGYCDRFNNVDPEFSRSYEVGLKAYLFDRRAYFEVATYRQSFDGFVRRGSGFVRFLGEDINGAESINTGSFTFNADVEIDGVDALVRFDITDDWNIGFSGSYNHSLFNNANVVCNDGDFDGIPDASDPDPIIVHPDPASWLAAGGPPGPAICPGQNTPAVSTPLWNASMRTEYNFATPGIPGTRSFVRFNYNYYPVNDRADSTPPILKVKERNMVDLFFGVRAEDRSWEVQAFVRNLLDEHTLTSYSDTPSYSATDIASPFITNYFTTDGNQYRSFSRVAEREVGVTLRYNF